jgi:hypothetical protein
MARIKIDNKIVISYDDVARDKYWKALSKYLIEKYGKVQYSNHKKVENILKDSFQFLVDSFRQLILIEKRFPFFLYVHWLHEQSIDIYIKTLRGFKLEGIREGEFAMYRRLLKLILEQGCDVDLDWGGISSGKDVEIMDNKIQELIYLGTWMYQFADYISFQKMVEGCYQISFDDKDLLTVEWRFHYGVVYKKFFPTLSEDYKNAIFDERAGIDFKAKIEECFNINYDFAGGIIFEIQKLLNPETPDLQTIEPYVLPLNLANQYGIGKELAEIFYGGLTISRINKLTIEDAILKPHSTKRYMFRPILVYKIGGVERALIGKNKFSESIMVLSTNAIHWNTMLDEWLTLNCMQSFITKKGNEHDKILEDKIEEIIRNKRLRFCRNIKSFKRASKKNNINIDNESAGEIDFIIINSNQKTIYVADVKYNRARYEVVGYRMDYTQFINPEKPHKSYETKLSKKVTWVRNNLSVLKEHLCIFYNKPDIDLEGYEVEGIFIINTPTFYMFNGQFKAITLKQFEGFIEGSYKYPDLRIINGDGDYEMFATVSHPYFKEPIILRDDEMDNE